MAINPINIVVNDRISPDVGRKLREIADTARTADAALDGMRSSLDGLSNAETRAAVNSERLAQAKAKTTTAEQQAIAATERATAAAIRRENAGRTVVTTEEQVARLLLQRARGLNAVKRAEEQVVLTQNRLNVLKREGIASTTALAAAEQDLASAQNRLAGETTRLNIVEDRLAENQEEVARQMRITTGEIRNQAAALNDNIPGMNRHNEALAMQRTRSGLAAHQAQNLAFQVQDIGVSLASGQPAWRVFLQQGAQIQGIMMQAGIGVAGLTRALYGMAAGAFAAMAPFLPLFAAIGGGILLLDNMRDRMEVMAGRTGEVSDELRGATGALGDFLDQGFTMMDVIGGIGLMFTDMWNQHVMPTLGNMWQGIVGVFETIAGAARSVVNFLVANWVAAFNSIRLTWRQLPAALGDFMFTAANAVIGGVEFLINSVVSALNSFIEGTNSIFEPLRGLFREIGVEVGEFGQIGEVSLGRLENAYAGVAGATANTVREQFAMAHATDFVGVAIDFAAQTYEDFLTTLVEYTEQARENRIEEERRRETLSRAQELYESIKGPILSYTEDVRALNALLDAGAITQREYNDAMRELELPTGLRELDLDLAVAGGDSFARERQEIEEQLEERRLLLEQAREANIISEQEYQDRLTEVVLDAERQRTEIQSQEMQNRAAALSAGFADIARIMGAAAGEQSDLARTAFAISKAFAIAESIIAIQQGIAQAMKIPFPANIPIMAGIAAQGASIIATIQGTTPAYAEGGYVSGPGGPTDDMITARLSNGEYVVNAAATRRHRGLLEAINDNQPTSVVMKQAAVPGYATGGMVTNKSSSQITNQTTAVDRSVDSRTSNVGPSIAFGDITIGNGMSRGEVEDILKGAIDKSMKQVYGPQLLGAARQQANDDMTDRFQTSAI